MTVFNFGMIYGYARISKATQNIERQLRNIGREYPDAMILKEAWTGTTMERPQWRKLKKTAKDGDTIIFDSVSRMSRDAEAGFQEYKELFDRGVSLIFLKEPQINTETYRMALRNAVPMTGTAVDLILEGINAYLMELAKEQIRLAFRQAEKEVEDLHQRTKEGIETARLNGKQIGSIPGKKKHTKKEAAAKETMRKHGSDFGGTLSDKEVIRLTGVSRNTYYKYKREIREGR